jgi:hypothetical protein
MGDRSAIRLAIDLGFAAAIIGCAISAYVSTRAPDIPAGLCSADGGGPRYDAMLADGRITIAAVIGELEGGPTDHNAWSYHVLANELAARGFTEVGLDRYQLGAITIDVSLVPDDIPQTNAALAGALASHDVVYYNGHSQHGELRFDPPADYRVVMLDSCWSTQQYASQLVAPGRDVLTNADRSVTGSIESLLVLVDALAAREPHWPLARMNELAAERAHKRAPVSRFKDPEHYRVDARCQRP